MPNGIVVVATLRPLLGHEKEVIDILLNGMAPVHDEPGCVLYALHSGTDGRIVFIEKWENAATLNAHAAGSAVAANDAKLVGLIEGPADIQRLTSYPALAGNAAGAI